MTRVLVIAGRLVGIVHRDYLLWNWTAPSRRLTRRSRNLAEGLHPYLPQEIADFGSLIYSRSTTLHYAPI